MKKKISKDIVPRKRIQDRIFIIRGRRVMLDSDLARVYRVETRALVQAVKRNVQRFPADFIFRLTPAEWESLRSQFVISKGRGGRRYLPYAFTEHGAVMAANVLNSREAMAMSVYVVRAFIRLREIFAANQVLEDRLAEIETILLSHDVALRDLYKKIKSLLLPVKQTRAVGFYAP